VWDVVVLIFLARQFFLYGVFPRIFPPFFLPVIEALRHPFLQKPGACRARKAFSSTPPFDLRSPDFALSWMKSPPLFPPFLLFFFLTPDSFPPRSQGDQAASVPLRPIDTKSSTLQSPQSFDLSPRQRFLFSDRYFPSHLCLAAFSPPCLPQPPEESPSLLPPYSSFRERRVTLAWNPFIMGILVLELETRPFS